MIGGQTILNFVSRDLRVTRRLQLVHHASWTVLVSYLLETSARDAERYQGYAEIADMPGPAPGPWPTGPTPSS